MLPQIAITNTPIEVDTCTLRFKLNGTVKIGKGELHYLSYEYTTEGGYTVHTSTGSTAEAKELEAFFNQHNIPITVKGEEKQSRR